MYTKKLHSSKYISPERLIVDNEITLFDGHMIIIILSLALFEHSYEEIASSCLMRENTFVYYFRKIVNV